MDENNSTNKELEGNSKYYKKSEFEQNDNNNDCI